MSRILAVETASEACSVALWHSGQVEALHRDCPRQHAQQLLPMVHELLNLAGVSLSELDAIAFGRGPGSFTGLRIAAAATQGLALAHDLPVLPISTLRAMAYTAHQQLYARHVITALDARMDELYWCCWRWELDHPEALHEERLSAPEALLLDKGEDDDWVLVGSGADYDQRFPPVVQSRIQQQVVTLGPQADAMAVLAAQDLAAGLAVDAAEAMPVYLRDQVTHQRR